VEALVALGLVFVACGVAMLIAGPGRAVGAKV
jgi:hypothetical protein